MKDPEEKPFHEKSFHEKPVHWSRQKEQAAGYWHLKFLLVLFRVFPLIVLRLLAFPVGFFYFLFSKSGRTESHRFLTRAAPFVDNSIAAHRCRSPLGPLMHIISFSLSLVEKLQSWGGKFLLLDVHYQDDDVAELIEGLENGKGAFLITSHLGNIELLRGLVHHNRTSVSKELPITAIVDVKATGHFNRMIKELNPKSGLNIISTNEIGPHTAVLLEEKLAAGEMVTVAGDRTSAGSFERNLMIPFLGEEAPFSPGAFYLAALLKAPVYFIFALRQKVWSLRPKYDMHVHKFGLSSDSTRKERAAKSAELVRSFAELLERYCKKNPFQWYNFYDFWSKGG